MKGSWRTLSLLSAALLLSGACDLSPPTEPQPADDSPEGDTRAMDIPITNDFVVEEADPSTPLTGVGDPQITAGGGATAILAFERPRIDPRCIIKAELRLGVTEVASTDNELAVYPSHVFSASDKKEGDPFGFAGTLLDTRPRTLFEGTIGWTESDITSIVKLWLGRRAFPSQGKRAPGTAPIVIALREINNSPPHAFTTFKSREAEGVDAPQLRLELRRPACRTS